MNRYDACHLWDRNRYDLNSFFFILLWQGLMSVLMFHFSISTNIVNKKGNFRN